MLKPHREVLYPNYMEMSPVSVSQGGALMSCVAEPRNSPIISEILGIHESLDADVQPVTHFSHRVSVRGGAVRWKNKSHMGFRPPTPSPGRVLQQAWELETSV